MLINPLILSKTYDTITIPRSPYPPGIPKSVQINCIECLLATMSRQPLQFNHLTFSQWNEQHLHQIPQNVVAVAACDSFQFFWCKQGSSQIPPIEVFDFPLVLKQMIDIEQLKTRNRVCIKMIYHSCQLHLLD